jgi:hypothetical protein
MLSISTNPYVLLLLVNVLLIIVGMFLDSTTAILVIAPIIAKPLVAAGVDPVHLGMVVVFNLMIGLLTPPMGLALFLVADIAKVTMKEVLREMVPYYVPLGITLLLITYVPEITTWIPRIALSREHDCTRKGCHAEKRRFSRCSPRCRCLRCLPPIARVDAQPAITDRYATVNGVKLHYLAAGQGSVVILLHGYAQNSHMWRPLMKELAKTHLVIAPDLRGFGDITQNRIRLRQENDGAGRACAGPIAGDPESGCRGHDIA